MFLAWPELSRQYVLLPVFDLEKGKSSLVFPFKIVDFGYFTSFLRQVSSQRPGRTHCVAQSCLELLVILLTQLQSVGIIGSQQISDPNRLPVPTALGLQTCVSMPDFFFFFLIWVQGSDRRSLYMHSKCSLPGAIALLLQSSLEILEFILLLSLRKLEKCILEIPSLREKHHEKQFIIWY